MDTCCMMWMTFFYALWMLLEFVYASSLPSSEHSASDFREGEKSINNCTNWQCCLLFHFTSIKIAVWCLLKKNEQKATPSNQNQY